MIAPKVLLNLSAGKISLAEGKYHSRSEYHSPSGEYHLRSALAEGKYH
jgi:hypothetical protein